MLFASLEWFSTYAEQTPDLHKQFLQKVETPVRIFWLKQKLFQHYLQGDGEFKKDYRI